MRRSFVVSGAIALLVAAAIYLTASRIAASIPILVQGAIGVAVAFAILLLVSLAEMPMMVYGLQQMARSKSTPRALMTGTYAVYVTFGSVYAAIFVLIAGQVWWGVVLAALCLARFASGVWIK